MFNHNEITLTLPRSLLFLRRFYYPILAVNYDHLRAFVDEAIRQEVSLFPERTLPAPRGGCIQQLPKAAAKELLTALRGSALGASASAHTDRQLIFEDIYSLKVSKLSVSCLFVWGFFFPLKNRSHARKAQINTSRQPTATAHAAGCWAALAAGRGASVMSHLLAPHRWDRASACQGKSKR